MKVKNCSPLIQCVDMQRSLNFYRDVLGFEVVQVAKQETGHLWWAMLKSGNATFMLNSKYEGDFRPAAPEPPAGRGDVTFYFDIEDADAAYSEIKGKWEKVMPPKTESYGMRQVTVVDPDGFVLCFHHPVK